MNGIDAPEAGQAFSQVAKATLSTLVFGQDVVVWNKIDRYGRMIGTLLRETLSATFAQLEAGLAWYSATTLVTSRRRIVHAV